MDNNKLNNDCRKCIHKKDSFLQKMIDNIELGPFLMWISIIIAGFTLIIHFMPMVGKTGAVLLICAFLFLIGLIKELFFW